MEVASRIKARPIAYPIPLPRGDGCRRLIRVASSAFAQEWLCEIKPINRFVTIELVVASTDAQAARQMQSRSRFQQVFINALNKEESKDCVFPSLSIAVAMLLFSNFLPFKMFEIGLRRRRMDIEPEDSFSDV